MTRCFALLLAFACGGESAQQTSELEGVHPGDCTDGDDNDADGHTDCADADCANSLECCEDTDGDGVCDAADACEAGDDAQDTDLDGLPDACDPCPDDPANDLDGDGVCDSDDRCPGVDDTVDTDGDGMPDPCDRCPLDPGDDSDGDTLCDSDDVCPGGDDRLDRDFDGVADSCDPCPDDRADDSDGDGTCDSVDVCPGEDDAADEDGDGLPDACDICPTDADGDADGDGVCDAVDVCPGASDHLDFDQDGVPDGCDLDADGDGWELDDCDDLDPDVHPQAGDRYGDGLDPDCDGADCDGTLVGGVYFVTCPFSGDQPAAEAYCQGLGYDGLASVHDDTEHGAILLQGDEAWTPWLGGSDAATEGAWTWSTGNPLRFANWVDGAPLVGTGPTDADCMLRRSRDDASVTARGYWADEDCSAVLDAAVCEVRCALAGDSDGDGRCDDVDSCIGEDRARDLDGDGLCDDQDADAELRAYYPFDGGTADLGPDGLHGLPMGGVGYRSGVAGSSVDLDGIDGYVETGLRTYEPVFTISYWSWVDSDVAYDPVFLAKPGAWGIVHRVGFLLFSNASAQGAYLLGGEELHPLRWRHHAIVVDHGMVSSYVDGIHHADETTDATYMLDTGDPLYVGWSPVDQFLTQAPLDGRIDELRIYGRALSAVEIATLAAE